MMSSHKKVGIIILRWLAIIRLPGEKVKIHEISIIIRMLNIEMLGVGIEMVIIIIIELEILITQDGNHKMAATTTTLPAIATALETATSQIQTQI